MLDSLRRQLFAQQQVMQAFESSAHTFGGASDYHRNCFATLIAVPSIVLATIQGMWQIAATDAMGLALAIGLWRTNSLSYRARAWALCWLLYSVGIALLYLQPAQAIRLPDGVAPACGDIPGSRIHHVTSILNAATLFVIGYFGKLDIDVPGLEDHPVWKWMVVTGNFAFVNAMVTISINILLRGLESSLGTVRESEERFRTAFLT